MPYNFEKIVEHYKWYNLNPERGITVDSVKEYIDTWGTLELSNDHKMFRRINHPSLYINEAKKMIKIKDVKIPQNYVMVKPDADHETFQIAGRETGIYAGTSLDTTGQIVSVTGTVLSVPLRLKFLDEEIYRVRRHFGDGDEGDSKVGEVKKDSVRYKVPIEIENGDKVIFFYKNQFDCYKDGRALYTEEGTVFLIKYDELYCIYRGNDDFTPLNGLIFLEPMEMSKEFLEGSDFEKLPSGLIKPTFSHEGFKKKGKIAVGKVTHVGCICSGYLDFLDQSDSNFEDIKVGDIVFYHPNYATNLQFDLHQSLSERKRVRLHRKDLFGVVEQNGGLDAKEVLTNFKFK